ncbi:hypothetical protein FGLOB1_13751 [Fusarium globosum]|uniref:Uncharacterized protein n=1 Tax=Fusarium globosum TaxID=78864 RepID=A0A8H6CXS5_9HYPO|nr:hypothetical protein FGLOB1_13751 [Fusarium globosum]
MLDSLAIETAAQVLEIWSYVYSQIDCVNLPILRALIAEHQDFLLSISDIRAREVLRLSITVEALSTEKIFYGSELAALRNKMLCVVTQVKDKWIAFLSWPDTTSLSKLQVTMANCDSILCDLETQQRHIVKDATIHVKIKRKRSPSPYANHKQRSEWQQPASEHFKPTTPPLKKQDCRDEVFRGLVAMAYPQRKHINHIMQPAAGELYLVYNTQSRCWLVALILPYTNLRDVGITGTLESLGLLKRIPNFLERRTASRTRTSCIEPASPDKQPIDHNGRRSSGWNTPAKNESTETHFSTARANSRQQFRITRSGSFLCAVPQRTKSSGVHHTFDKPLVPASTTNPAAPGQTYLDGDIEYANPLCPPCPIDTPVCYDLPYIDSNNPKFKTLSLPSFQTTFRGVPGTRFGLFKWPELAEPSERVLYKLSGMSKIKGVKPLPRDFLDREGLFCCPLCPDTKQFEHLSLFTEHLSAQH